ncbi:MAG: hypothetical protein AB9842_09235 [Bacteroidales bacterium]
MKRTLLFTAVIIFLAGMSGYAQKNNAASPKKSTTESQVKPAQDASATTDKAAPQQPQKVQRPKLSKEDSLKRVHRIDSIKKVMAEKRLKEGRPVLSKQDSLKRAHKIDSLRKAAKERKQTGDVGPQPYKPRPSKQDSLKNAHKMDSIRKAAETKMGKQPVPQKKADKK